MTLAIGRNVCATGNRAEICVTKMRLKVLAARNETQFQMKVVAKMRLNFKIGVARKEA